MTLLIIDEVHLLADERGAVIETIVARTQRYVESSQKLVSSFWFEFYVFTTVKLSFTMNCNVKSGQRARDG